MKKLIASALALMAAGMLSAQVHFGLGARGEFGFGLGSSLHSDVTGLSSHYDYSVQPFKSFLAGGALIGRVSFDAVPGLFIQPELGFSHNRIGYKTNYSDTDYDTDYSYNRTTHRYDEHTIKTVVEWESESSYGYNSIDFPILVGYDFEVGSGMVVSPFAGLSLSIPVGSFSTSSGKASGDVTTYYDGNQTSKVSYRDDDDDDSSGSTDTKTTLIPGAIVGAGFGYKFDQHNMIMGDLRYLLDFTPVQAEVNFLGVKLDWNIFTRRGLKLGFNYVYMF